MNGKGIYHHGSKDIVSRYEFSNNPRGSRTGMGIMISKEKIKDLRGT